MLVLVNKEKYQRRDILTAANSLNQIGRKMVKRSERNKKKGERQL